jgi:glycosyltransferase involved in cell wall biosynthesis
MHVEWNESGRMNVTIVQGAFKPVPAVTGGSVEKLWFELGREFARRGMVVTHISRRFPGLPPGGLLDGVMHLRVRGYDHPKSRMLAKWMDLVYSLRCLFALKPADVIVTNTFFLPLILSLFKRRTIVYVSVHRYPQGQMKLYAKVDRLQCVSTAVADAVRSQAPAVGGLVKVVPNYVPALLTRDEVLQGWSQRRHEVLFVGRIHPEKGVDLLMRAFAGIDPALRAKWTLRVVGPHDGPAGGAGSGYLASLKQIAAGLGLEVDWAGPIYAGDALNEAYRRARIFVYPSIAAKGEAFPLAPLEAMAQGCPVVTSDLSCFSDYVRSGVNAEMFALAEPDGPHGLGPVLQSLMGDEPRLQALSQRGLETVQDFTLTRVADAFIADFSGLRKP